MKLLVDYEYFKEKRNIVQREIKRKNANYLKEQLQKYNDIIIELWKALKNLGVACKVSHQKNDLLQLNGSMKIEKSSTLKKFIFY